MSNPNNKPGVEIFMKLDYWFGNHYALRYELKKGDPALGSVYLEHYKNADLDQRKVLDPHLVKAILLLKDRPKFIKKLQKDMDLDLDLGETLFGLIKQWAEETKHGQEPETQNRKRLDRKDVDVILRPSFSTYLEGCHDQHKSIVNFLLARDNPSSDVITHNLLKELEDFAEKFSKRIKAEEDEALKALTEQSEKKNNRTDEVKKEMEPIPGTFQAHGSSSGAKEPDDSTTKSEKQKGSNKSSGKKPASGNSTGSHAHGKTPGKRS